jgi:glycine/D-amino acid oxidase-like deaminating enzyme
MRLRTYESFWLLKNGLLYTYPLLQQNIKTDYIVIGGGITGALISDVLIENGYRVVVIDHRDIGQGSTAATTCMLQYEIDEMLVDLAAMIGEEAAARCYQAGIVAITDMQKLVSRKKIDCDFELKKSLYIAHNKKAAVKLHKEFLLRKKHRLGVKWLSSEQVLKQYGLVSHGGILSATAGSADAYKLAHELIKQNTQQGLQVFDQTCIKKITEEKNGATVHTAEGHTLRAKKIIFCTGYESTYMLKEKIARLFNTYACVSETAAIIPRRLQNTLVWDTSDPYIYLRTTGDGRLLIGGEDSDKLSQTNQQNIKEKKSDHLIKKINKLIPGINFIEDFSWGGVFGSTKDGLPYIGVSPEYKHGYFVLGFGGNGITFSMQARNLLMDYIHNQPNELANYYRFGR